MNLHQLRCFVLAADELHFGRAAQKADMLPSALGRFIRLLEEDLGTALFDRTTRSVVLTEDGKDLLADARQLLARSDAIRTRFRERVRRRVRKLRIGAIDSAAMGLVPMLLNDFRQEHQGIEVELIEDKTIRLLPRILSSRLDVAFVRPPMNRPKTIGFRHILFETPVIAVPSRHPLARRRKLTMDAIASEPLIVPDRRSRPHSYDMTMKLFEEAGHSARVAQVANEKQTIVHLVSSGIGLAIVPRWISRMALAGVTYVPLVLTEGSTTGRLPLAAAWLRGSQDALRDALLATLHRDVDLYGAHA